MQTATTEWLASIEALQGVPVDQLQWMIDNSRHYTVPAGDSMFKIGDVMTGTHVIIDGKLRFYVPQGQEFRDLIDLGPKDISGNLPFSRGNIAKVNGKVIEDASVMTLPTETYREMISRHFELTEALVHVMLTRVRYMTSFQQQNEKMMALGKLSAGLAHELNNPAAAIVRGSESLITHLQLEPATFKDVISIRMEEQEIDLVKDKLFEVLNRADKPTLTLMQRTGLEDGIRDWLEDHQVQNIDEIAENFLEYGFTSNDLDVFKDHIPEKYLSPIFNWINTNLVTERLVQDIQEASKRIFYLVQSVKNFTHMDQGKGKELTDIHEGIHNTLTMMQYKLKKGNIELKKEFDRQLPKVLAMVGELNQVWTNIIDNALDAMEAVGRGQLMIRTEKDRQYVKVSVIDNGPGIPEEIKSRIFDPFFTTKDIGKGMGMGLDVVSRIVAQHNGVVKVNSEPGRTEFIVCFPIKG